MRKLIIGLIAMGSVALMFLIYARVMDTAPIQTPNQADVPDLNMPQPRNTGQQTGEMDVRDARDAEYYVFDEQTKEIIRTLGFKKLLNPGSESSRWEVGNPYLIFYESNYQCRIDADKGVFQTTSGGSGAVPKDARLDGNVVIQLTPEAGSRMSETFIKMDDLTFSSERSEFATDGPVSIQSEQVQLEGFGLILIFDTAAGRIDYLNIRDLEILRILNVSESEKAAKAKGPAQRRPLASSSVQPSGSPPRTIDSTSGSQEKTASPSEYYECVFDENVEITYGNELVLSGADQVNIQNILFSAMDGGDRAVNSPDSVDHKREQKQKNSGQVPKEPVKTPPDSNSAKEVLVRCDGGIVLKPMQDEMTAEPAAKAVLNKKTQAVDLFPAQPENALLPPTIQMVNLAGEADAAGTVPLESVPTAGVAVVETTDSEANNAPPAKFEARKIDYDLLTGSGLAHGPVRFTDYQPADSNDTTAHPWVPIVVMADKDAQFIADESRTIKQVIFNENVLATRRWQQVEYTQLDNFHGEKLTVFFDKNAMGRTGISRIRMTEGRVYVQSQRFKDEQTLSNVKLYCTEISYDRIKEEIIAKGPDGEIQLNNSHVPDASADGASTGVDLDKPCYVYVNGFDSIQWNLAEQKIVADGQQNQLQLAYVPLVNGVPEKYIFVNSIRFDLDYVTDSTTGETAIKRVFTDKPITYEELSSDKKQVHNIVGQTLVYDTVDTDGWVRIEGTPAVPVEVDNVRVPFVYLHPFTGQVDTSLSTAPGILKTR